MVPLFQEREWLKKGFAKHWASLSVLTDSQKSRLHFRFCSWSEGHETAVAVALLQDHFDRCFPGISWECLSHRDGAPSVVASLQIGFSKPIPSEFVLLCPSDCALDLEGIGAALAFVDQANPNQWALFRKTYLPTTALLSASAWFQRHFVIPFLKENCWTNLFLIPSTVFPKAFFRDGFLEDLEANRRLRQILGPPRLLNGAVVVSSRRYLGRGVFVQMQKNVGIYFRYAAAKRHPEQKSKIYSRLRNIHEGKS